MEVLNNLGRLDTWVPWCAGQITQDSSGAAPTVATKSGLSESDQQQVSYSRTSAGIYVLTITNFRGLNGAIVGSLTPTTTGTGFTANFGGAPTYSGDTATVTINTYNSSATAADCSVAFNLFGI